MGPEQLLSWARCFPSDVSLCCIQIRQQWASRQGGAEGSPSDAGGQATGRAETSLAGHLDHGQGSE